MTASSRPSSAAPSLELSGAAVRAVDADDMANDVLEQPAQLADALWRVESADIAEREAPDGLVVCGMGGSGIGARLAAAVIGSRARRPVRSVQDYAPEPWVGPGSLVLCSSYSGETEEVLSCFEAAGAAGARRVVLTTGGRLAAAAREEGVPVIGVPAGFQPRAAVIYMTVAVLECAALCGAVAPLREEIEGAAGLLGDLVAEWGPDSPHDSEAKALAMRLNGALPVVYGSQPTVAAAMRWKTQINENAKLPAFWSALPEADHNELCGYEGAAGLAPLYPVFLEEPAQHRRIRDRVELTAEVAAEGAAGIARVSARGESAAERVLSLVLLGDLVSLYLAVLGGKDPTPVEALDRFKAQLR